MMHPGHFVIRPATDDDRAAIHRLALLDSRPPPLGPVLVGEIDGVPAAALSVDGASAVADPFQRTELLVSYLRVRAGAIRAVGAEPSLRRRLLSGVSERLRPAPLHA